MEREDVIQPPNIEIDSQPVARDLVQPASFSSDIHWMNVTELPGVPEMTPPALSLYTSVMEMICTGLVIVAADISDARGDDRITGDDFLQAIQTNEDLKAIFENCD
ncbi:hypothetical protein AVEN_112066-1 [Araneus ventricosus]|uniref:Uncharacterized protein n=1 Tax=Araneus ventricosus TaxID=182803 RepID=A0A4Y2JTW9_ARAVE|nr:hypothetical protein AVEN_112066-1 [Araneus ventricosus]